MDLDVHFFSTKEVVVFYHKRKALSLLELIIVIAILAIIIGLILPAIISVRRAALRIDDTNRLKQIALSTIDVTGTRDGKLPMLRGPKESEVIFVQIEDTPYPSLFLHTWANAIPEDGNLRADGYKNRFYQSPADPSYSNSEPNNFGHVSYVANALTFKIGNNLSKSFPDGLSNTIFWSTHYARCGSAGSFDFWHQWPSVHIVRDHPSPGEDPINWEPNVWWDINRRSTFADEDCGDAIPKAIDGQPPVAYGHSQHKKGSYYYAIMPQFAPKVDKCNSYVPNSFYADGILVAMGDGSVRFLSKSVSESTFWAAVTPAGGEVLGGDW